METRFTDEQNIGLPDSLTKTLRSDKYAIRMVIALRSLPPEGSNGADMTVPDVKRRLMFETEAI